MLSTIIRKIKLYLKNFLYLLLYYPNRKLNTNNNRRLIDEIKVQLEWCLQEILENYPRLTLAQAENVIEMFYKDRFIPIQEAGTFRWSIFN